MSIVVSSATECSLSASVDHFNLVGKFSWEKFAPHLSGHQIPPLHRSVLGGEVVPTSLFVAMRKGWISKQVPVSVGSQDAE